MEKNCSLIFHYLKAIFIFILVSLLSCTSLIAQSKLADDWEKELAKAKGQDRIKLIVQLTEDLAKTNRTLAESLAIEGIALAKQVGDSLSMYRIIANRGRLYYFANEKEKGMEWVQKGLNFFEKDKKLGFDKSKYQLCLSTFYIDKREFVKADSLITDCEPFFKNSNDVLWQSKILQNQGYLNWIKQEYEKAIHYFSAALNMSKHLNDIEQNASTTRAIGALKMTLGLYPESLERQFQVIEMDCSNQLKSKSYDDIGLIYIKLEDWESAMKYTKKAIELKKELANESSLAYSLYSLGVIHHRLLNYGEALNLLKQSLAIFKKYNNDNKTGEALGVMGNIYSELGKSIKANEYYNEQLELAKSKKNWEGVWYVNYNRGYYLHEAKKYNEALKYLLKSLQIAEEKKHLPFLLKNYAQLTNTYDKLPGKEDKSEFYAAQYDIIEDSIKSYKQIKKIGALEQKHTSKLQQDSLGSSNQKNISLNHDKGILSKFKNIIGFCLLILFLGLSFFIFKKYRLKEVDPIKNNSLDQAKIEQYFQEVFARLDQNNKTNEAEKNHSSNPNAIPINDIANFLKTNLSSENDWASFEQYFEKVHKDFFKNLKMTYPNITVNELNMCALLKLNLRNKDIAQIMGIGHDSIRVAQNRLSKKLELPAGVVLRDFVLKI